MFDRILLVLLCPLVALLSACSAQFPTTSSEAPVGDDEESGSILLADTGEVSPVQPDSPWATPEPVVLADHVVLPEDHSCFEAALVATTTVDFTTHCSGENLGIEPGSLLIGADGGGYLVRALSVTTTANHVSVTTEAASFDEAFVSGGFRATLTWPTTAREVIDLSGLELVTEDFFAVTLGTATLALKPTVFIGGSFASGEPPVAEGIMSIYTNASLEFMASVSQAASSAGETFLDEFHLPYEFVIPTADGRTVPMVGNLELQLDGIYELETNDAMDAIGSLELSGSAELGQRWNGSSWSNVEERDMDLQTEAEEVHAQGGGRFKVQLRIRAKLRMAGTDGPVFSLGPYFQLDAREECEDVRYQLEGGFELGAFTDLSSFAPGLEGNYGPWTRKEETVSGTLPNEFPEPDCEEEPVPPPSGPDPEPPLPPAPTPSGQGQPCAPAATISCGQTVSGNTASDPAATSSMDAYPINVGNYEAPEIVYEWSGGAGVAEFRMPGARPTQVNHDIMVIDGSSGECNAGNAVAWGFNSLDFQPQGPGPFYIVVDGYFQDAGAFQLQLRCE